jgi:hypothetical protein
LAQKEGKLNMAGTEDTLDADIAAAFDSVTSSPSADVAVASPAVAAPSVDTPEAPKGDDRARDESGRFKAKEGENPATAETPKVDGPQANAPDPAAPVLAEQPKPTDKITPPQNWKGQGKVAWDRLPPAIQKEISEDYAQRAQLQDRVSRLDAAIGPDQAQRLAVTYGSVEGGIQNLLAMSDMATKNPTGFVLWFAQQRGLDLTQLAGQGTGQGEQPTQDSSQLAQKVTQLETYIQNLVQQQQQGTQSQLQSDIDRFASDPAHPYFNDVRQSMAALIKMDRAKDLQQAYDMAVWADPTIRQTLIEAERSKTASAQAATAQQAMSAAVSISGSPAGAKVVADEPSEDLEGTIRRAASAVLG